MTCAYVYVSLIFRGAWILAGVQNWGFPTTTYYFVVGPSYTAAFMCCCDNEVTLTSTQTERRWSRVGWFNCSTSIH